MRAQKGQIDPSPTPNTCQKGVKVRRSRHVITNSLVVPPSPGSVSLNVLVPLIHLSLRQAAASAPVRLNFYNDIAILYLLSQSPNLGYNELLYKLAEYTKRPKNWRGLQSGTKKLIGLRLIDRNKNKKYNITILGTLYLLNLHDIIYANIDQHFKSINK